MQKLSKKKVLEIKDEDKIYEYLLDKVYELGKNILDIKNIKYEKSEFTKDKEHELYSIQQKIYYHSIWFESFRSLADKVRFRYEEDSLEEKVEFIIKVYNELVFELSEYKKQKEKIEKEGFENLEKKLKTGLREIFCKMLDHKKRTYKKDSSLPELIKELTLCYSDFKWLFDDTYTMLVAKMVYRNTERDDFWRIDADNVEYLSNLEFTYNYFSEDENTYKNYTQYYEDITLREGQSLKDLYYEEKEKLRELLVEMLDFINIDVKDKENYTQLEILVRKYYPYYIDNFTILNGTASYSYIDSIHFLKSNYDYFKRTYKNHKEMLKNYVKQEEEWYEKSKYDEELCYYPEGLEDLKNLKNQFSEYFNDEEN